MSSETLTPLLRQLYDALDGAGDVPVQYLYTKVTGRAPVETEASPYRHSQQYLGPYFNKMNRRLKGARKKVVPGKVKGTYRLTTI